MKEVERLYPWERPYDDPLRKDRDIETAPYDRQEQRVCAYLQSVASSLGCGDDPIGFLIASHNFIMNQQKKEKQLGKNNTP